MKNIKINKAVLFAASLLTVGAANAEVPLEATAALTAVSTDAASLAASAWPVLASIVGTFVLMKLFKRFVSKAS